MVVGRRTRVPQLSTVAYLTTLYIPTLLLRSNMPLSSCVHLVVMCVRADSLVSTVAAHDKYNGLLNNSVCRPLPRHVFMTLVPDFPRQPLRFCTATVNCCDITRTAGVTVS